MNKYFIKFVITLTLNVGCFICLAQSKHSPIIDTKLAYNEKDWKTYANNEMGITFKIPPTWMKFGHETNAVNRTGAVMVRMINFIDTVSKSVFYLEYHLAPYGTELFKYEKRQFDSLNTINKTELKQISIAGYKIAESFSTMSSDIKGNIYDPPLRFVHVFFLNKKQSGEFDLNYRTLLPISDIEIAKFNQVLSTIKFTN